MRVEKQACVASGHELVTKTAHKILKEGGNAFDAVVAAGVVSSIAEPTLTSLGGGGFLLARTADGDTTLFDFFVNTPGLGRTQRELTPHFFPVTIEFPGCHQDFNIGMGSVAVPGNIKGFLHVHERLGRLPLKTCLEPAIELARNGVTLNHHQAYFNSLLEPILTLSTEGKSLYAPGGRYLQEGDLFRNPWLASFLEELAREGDALFYQGLAPDIEKAMDEGQGMLTARDLEEYRVIERSPLRTEYRGHTFLTNPPPSFGGWLICLGLNCLNAIELSGIEFGSKEHLVIMSHFLREWDELRSKCHEDPGCSHMEGVRSRLKRLFSRGTTHISVVDYEGNAASMTTSNGEGSGYIVPGTGIMLNNMMGEDDLHPNGFHQSPPGIRVSSMMAPSMLIQGAGGRSASSLLLVLGSGGSKRIRSAILEVLSYCLDFGMNIEEAVNAPRIHYEEGVFQLEPGFPETSIEVLGHGEEYGNENINIWSDINVYFGGVNAIDVRAMTAKADPRRGGFELCMEMNPETDRQDTR